MHAVADLGEGFSQDNKQLLVPKITLILWGCQNLCVRMLPGVETATKNCGGELPHHQVFLSGASLLI